jgi:hypothetical protein
MARKQPKTPATSGSSGSGNSGRLARRLIAVVLTLAAVAGLVWGVAWLGDEARRGIGPRDRYAVRFADVACDPPPGYERAAFLSEVRYISDFPESFQSLDPDLHTKLAAAFTAHPWVAAVEGVSVDASGAVRVALRHRVPALAVKTEGGTVRVVDAGAVLLPVAASAAGLPELTSPVPAPTTRDGRVWDNAVVRRAAELVAAHKPRTLEKTPQGWRLTTTDGKTLLVEK